MEEDERNRLVDLVRSATQAFYDQPVGGETKSSVEVDYLSEEGAGHKVMVFAPSHEFENERPVWAEIGDLSIHLDPEKVGYSSYHVHVDISDSTEGD